MQRETSGVNREMTTRFEQQSEEFRAVLNELYELHQGKGGGYGSDDDHYFNIRQSQDFGVEPWIGATIRENDKMSRVKNFIKNGKLPYESVEDNLKDKAVYAIISLILYREGQKKKTSIVHSEITGETWDAPLSNSSDEVTGPAFFRSELREQEKK